MLGPIFVREWKTLPRRPQHYLIRTAYLGFLWILAVTAYLATVGLSREPTAGDLARFGQLLFQLFAYFQLTFLIFFAALSAAVAVAHEKDRRTFLLLLATEMRNREIVLGKLVGSLLQIVLLLVGTAGVFVLTLRLGGVSIEQIGQAMLILVATGLAAGSLGCLVALWREQTFQALALTVLFLVLYFCLARSLTLMSWKVSQLWLDPFQCLAVVVDGPAAKDWDFSPTLGFGLCMLLVSGLLNAGAIWRLRVWNPRGEPIIRREQADVAEVEKDRARAHAAPGPVRAVWHNPILWREIRTRAYGSRPLLVKAAYAVVIGLIAYYVLNSLGTTNSRGSFTAAYGLLPVSILSFLLLAAQAVTAITSERDKGALDLLLVTDLTPKEFIFGKLAGIAYNAKEYLLPPLLLAGVYAHYGLLATPPRGQSWSLLCVLGTIILLAAFVAMLGLHIGLRTEKSGLAITQTLGTVFFLSVGTLLSIALIAISGSFNVQWSSFLLFLAIGIAGLWWVLNGDRASPALTIASAVCPLAVFYSILNILIGKIGSQESSEPLVPFLVIAGAFGFAIAAMLIPLLSEFDVALGRTTGPNE
jgi:ABC-type transport system involved in multi-copper enzyme maturation permease subunit